MADRLAKTIEVRSAILDGEVIVIREHTPDFYALMFRRAGDRDGILLLTSCAE